MKLRFRLTLIVGLLSVGIIALVSVILLRQAWVLQTAVAYENTNNISYAESVNMQLGFEGFMDVIDTISKIYSSFGHIDMKIRRDYFDNMLLSAVKSNPNLIGIYSVWKPGIIDNGPPVYSTLYTREHSTKSRKSSPGTIFPSGINRNTAAARKQSKTTRHGSGCCLSPYPLLTGETIPMLSL